GSSTGSGSSCPSAARSEAAAGSGAPAWGEAASAGDSAAEAPTGPAEATPAETAAAEPATETGAAKTAPEAGTAEAAAEPTGSLHAAEAALHAVIRVRVRADRTTLDGVDGLLHDVRVNALERDDLDHARRLLGALLHVLNDFLNVLLHCLGAGHEQAVGALID